MTPARAPSRRISPATIALALAALLALATIAIALLRSNGEEEGSDTASTNTAAAEAPTTEASIAALRDRLRQDPDNHEGWFLLGLSYRGAERFGEATQAFRRAHELAPSNADYAAYLGEALLLGADGSPPPEAEQMFRRALELEPGNAQARYYIATLRDSRGDHRGAVDALLTLLGEAPANAPWEPQVREAVVAIAREHRIDIADRLPPPRAPQGSVATAAIPGPSAEQMQAARGIPPSQQDQMVRAMVDGLAARLRQNPRDADGWIRLMRSRMVLLEAPAAGEALRSALSAFSGDQATQARLRRAARELSVPGA